MSQPNQPMDQLWPLTVTVPAGTAEDNPLIVPWPLVDANLDFIDIIIPDGHSGQTGIAVYWSGTQILPWGTDTWIVANDEKVHTPINSYITVSGLSVYAYNVGQFEHSFYLRAHITYTTTPVVSEEGTIGASTANAPEDAIYDESLTPTGLTGSSAEEGTESTESFNSAGESDLTALPESVT
jgi:hypothetical protein